MKMYRKCGEGFHYPIKYWIEDPLIDLRQYFFNRDYPGYAFDCGLFPKIESNDKLEFEQKRGRGNVNTMTDALVKRISDLLNKKTYGPEDDLLEVHIY